MNQVFSSSVVYKVNISLFMARPLNSVREENISGVFVSVINRECIFVLILYGEWLTNKQMFYLTLWVFVEWDTMYTVKPRFTDTSFLWIFCFVPGERKPYIFFTFNPFNRDTIYGPSVSVLTRFNCARSSKFAYIWLYDNLVLACHLI